MSDPTGIEAVTAFIEELLTAADRIDRMGYDEIATAAQEQGSENLVAIITDPANEIVEAESGGRRWNCSKLDLIETWGIAWGYADAAKEFKAKHLRHVAAAREFRRWITEESVFEGRFAEAVREERVTLGEATETFLHCARMLLGRLSPGQVTEQQSDPWDLVHLSEMRVEKTTAGRHAKNPSKPFIRAAGDGYYEIRKSELRRYVADRFLGKFGT